MKFAFDAVEGCQACIVLHSCNDGPSVLMCRDYLAKCKECHAQVADEQPYRPGHAFVDCDECGARIGICAGDDLDIGLTRLLGTPKTTALGENLGPSSLSE